MTKTPRGPVRVRFAPSPTGFLHVGGARTAIYNELLRRKVGGALILRIEDTDRERSDEAMTRRIQEALTWIGVGWDEGPHLQSDRLDRHRERARELQQAGKAYRCFCSAAELAELRRLAQKRGETFRYPGTCSRLGDAEAEARAAAGEPWVLRLRMPEGRVRFSDLVRGGVDYPPDTLDDFVLLRSDGSPTYHLSVVVDDIDMGVTHVIRGEDHLPNTPKHIALFRALGAEVPVFAHLPLILGPDRKRLSKRGGAASVEELREQGFLPQAVYNYLALLGWSPGDEREILSREEMIRAFSVERLHASAAVFDPEKLSWVNAQYLSSLPLEEVLHHLRPFLAAAGLEGAEAGRLRAAVEVSRSRPRTLPELAGMLRPYFSERLDYDREVCDRFLSQPDLPEHLEALAERLGRVEAFAKEGIEEELRKLAAERGLKAGDLIHPTRMALTGVRAGPPLFDVVEAMGREATGRHLGHFIAFLRDDPGG